MTIEVLKPSKFACDSPTAIVVDRPSVIVGKLWLALAFIVPPVRIGCVPRIMGVRHGLGQPAIPRRDEDAVAVGVGVNGNSTLWR